MSSGPRSAVGVAIIRAFVGPGPSPVIRILEVADLFQDERVLHVTTSSRDAARVVRNWLDEVIERHAADEGASTPR
jgi:hypothetical protein